jgi:hypothetical protein
MSRKAGKETFFSEPSQSLPTIWPETAPTMGKRQHLAKARGKWVLMSGMAYRYDKKIETIKGDPHEERTIYGRVSREGARRAFVSTSQA